MADAPNPADLRAIFGMPPEDAIAYLRGKGYRITWDWHDVQAAAHARSFTVAKMTSIDLLRDVRNGLTDNFAAGKTVEDFVKDMQPTLEAKGWWGKQIIVDSKGGAEVAQLGSPRRLRTIYQTNAQSAFMGARYKALRAAISTHPYWMYVAVMDAATRPSHAALNGKVFRADDPVWGYIFPPNDYNCRCRVVALTEAEVKARGLKVESSAGRLGQIVIDMGVDKRTGEVRQASVAELETTNRAGKKILFHPAAGFSGSPVQSNLMDELLLQKAQQLLGDAAGLREVKNVLLAPARLQAWESFVREHYRSFSNGRPATDVLGGQSIAFGVMRAQDIAYAAQQGVQMQSGVMAIKSELLGGGKAFRHTTQTRNALTLSEWLALPRHLAQPELVLWDNRKKNFLYVFTAQDGRRAKIVIERGTGAEATDTVFKVSDDALQGGIEGGEYTRIP
ncbi:MAG: phage head morphogenesis protein [Pseudoxanthomonas spadix]|nr:MAG: phage head morphogenesis protein [Pseudoxanthomonas spadix]